LRHADIDLAADFIHRVRRLDCFHRHFSAGVQSIARDAGLAALVNTRACSAAFLDWIEAISAQKSAADLDRRDCIVFGAGMLLRSLFSERIVEVGNVSLRFPGSGREELIRAWPEGYVATSYCLTVLEGVLQQEGLAALSVTTNVNDIRFWESLRENCAESPSLAVPFFDAFVGSKPNRTSPTVAAERPAIRAVWRTPNAFATIG
jgi:hypothetical protein